MPIISTNEKRTKSSLGSKKNKTANDVILRRSKTTSVAPMLTEKIAPAGTYTSRIASVAMAKTERGADAVDVSYELTSASGKVVQGRLRYELDGFHFEKLADALIDAGLEEGSSIVDAVGIEEEIVLTYPHRGSLGKIKERRPLNGNAAKQRRFSEPDDLQDEEEDYLDEDEDDF